MRILKAKEQLVCVTVVAYPCNDHKLPTAVKDLSVPAGVYMIELYVYQLLFCLLLFLQTVFALM